MNFQSARLTYRNYTQEDEHLYVQLCISAKLMKYINGEAHSETDAKERFKKILAINADESPSAVYAVFHNDSQEYAGLAKFVFTKPGQAEIGYVLLEKFWGQQFGTEISKTMSSLANDIDGLEELIALIDPKNIASKRILEKCNFTLKELGTYQGLPCETYHLLMKNL